MTYLHAGVVMVTLDDYFYKMIWNHHYFNGKIDRSSEE